MVDLTCIIVLLISEIDGCNAVATFPSLVVACKPEIDCKIWMQEDLAKMGVMIRHYDKKELKGYVRVTAGKPEHTDALMDCLRRLS